jgi:hypothetical protein
MPQQQMPIQGIRDPTRLGTVEINKQHVILDDVNTNILQLAGIHAIASQEGRHTPTIHPEMLIQPKLSLM